MFIKIIAFLYNSNSWNIEPKFFINYKDHLSVCFGMCFWFRGGSSYRQSLIGFG